MSKLRVGIIVNDTTQSFLTYDLYLKSLKSDKYCIEYLIIQKPCHKSSFFFFRRIFNLIKKKGFKYLINKIFFLFLDKIESFIVSRKKKYKEVFKKHNLSKFNIPKIYVSPIISNSGLTYTYSSDDIKNISKLKLDVLIRGDSGILRSDILSVCRFGVLSFHHGDNDFNRGLPPGFWEVFYREPSTGFIIQRLTPELDGGDVIFKGNIATSFMYKENLCRLYIKSNVFLHQILEKLAHYPINLKSYPKIPYAYPLYTLPTSIQVLQYIFRTFFYGLKKIIGRFLKKNFRWSVAYQFTKDWKNTVLWKSITIKNPPFRFLADPFIANHNGNDVLFVEDYNYRSSRGKISAYEIKPTKYIELGVALEEKFHLSFPFLVRVKKDLYMVPESHENKDIRLYKCVDFPLKWKFIRALIKDCSCVDTSVFEFNNKWWMFTNKDSSELGDHGSELHIYYSDSLDSEKWVSHRANPVIFDSKRARNGGLIISNETIYRVFQRQGFDMYGASIGISKIIELSEINYEEEVLFDIPPKFMKNINGIHTYSFNSGVLSFDFVKYEDYQK